MCVPSCSWSTRLADVVQKSRTLCKVDVQSEFRRHRSGQLCHFDGMLIDVLSVACSVFESAEQFDEFRMQSENAHFKHGSFAVFLDLLVEFLADFFHRLLDAGGMDPAVADELFQSKAGDFPAHGGQIPKE